MSSTVVRSNRSSKLLELRELAARCAETPTTERFANFVEFGRFAARARDLVTETMSAVFRAVDAGNLPMLDFEASEELIVSTRLVTRRTTFPGGPTVMSVILGGDGLASVAADGTVLREHHDAWVDSDDWTAQPLGSYAVLLRFTLVPARVMSSWMFDTHSRVRELRCEERLVLAFVVALVESAGSELPTDTLRHLEFARNYLPTKSAILDRLLATGLRPT